MTNRTSTTRRPAIPLALAMALVLLLSACASEISQDSRAAADPSAESFSDVDIAFLEGMVPHHAQAVEMAELVDGRTGHPDELGELAAGIIATQQEEIDVMNGLLTRAGEDPAATGMDHEGMDMGGMQMEGMMSAEDMTMLADAEGDAFDGMFLQMMIAHHDGAILSAREVLEQTGDANDDVVALAEAIIAAQEAEIAQMQGWQEDWGV